MNHYQVQQTPKYQKQEGAPYVIQEGLREALNVALELGLPLLLTGEPGTGKTKFAAHVAQHFKDLYDTPFVFNAKTNSVASELFYSYDALRHYQLTHQTDSKANIDLIATNVIRFQALGAAIQLAEKKQQRAVVLIDEIDKAPRDFPNDLLNELDGDFIFHVPELGNQVFKAPKELKPVVIITSNSEKLLPEPFLRRCVYYHIEFPKDAGELLKIVAGQLETHGLKNIQESHLKKAIQHFFQIREKAELLNAKKPATAELISWLIILQKTGLLTKLGSDTIQVEDHKTLRDAYSVVAKSAELMKELIKDLNF